MEGVLSMTAHIDNVVRADFYSLRQSKAILRFILIEAAIVFARSVICARLDYI